MNRSIQLDKITMGTCYYPEHWDKSMWEEDMKRMLKAGIEVIRIAEFAWSKLEPEEGRFTFTFFDEVLEVAKKVGMKVIFSTPTATPPAWLTEKYPEVLNATVEGILFRHGARRHYNYNSPKYLELTARIVEESAKHYASHPSIIGWQIDNEINCQVDQFYSESDDIAFRDFVKKKYKSLDALNHAWGTVFWNQEYTHWEQVHMPRKVVSDSPNPHQFLDYIRFISASARAFCKLQSDILRKYIKKDDFITTNGMFANLDNHEMTEESLDFYMYDSYPNFAYGMGTNPRESTDLNDRKWSGHLSEVRSISKNFGIMEQQSGANGWNCSMEAPMPKPGQMTLWTMQSVAHGADFISYFRWRTCTMGTEIYWHGILDYSGRDNRRLKEVTEISEKFEKIKDVAGSDYVPAFGVIRDYDNIWDSQIDRWHQRVDWVSQTGIFQASQLTHTPMDYVFLRKQTKVEDLQKYPVLFYPHASLLTEERVALLTKYVENGGTLIFGCRTGYKDITGKCVTDYLPGLARELSGTDITDFTFVGPNDDRVTIDWDGTSLETDVFNDILQPLTDNSQVLGTYEGNYYKGEGGLIKNTYGKGQVYYYGSTFTRKSAEVFLQKLEIASPYKEIIRLSEDCELALRQKGEETYLFVLNYAHENSDITLNKEMFDLYSGENAIGDFTLLPYETKVYKLI